MKTHEELTALHREAEGQGAQELHGVIVDALDTVKEHEDMLDTDIDSRLMTEATALDKRRIAGNYGPRRAPGGDNFYDWLNACRAELDEVEDAYRAGNLGEVRKEIGDALMNLIQTALYLKITDPLEAGIETCDKVNSRLDYVEAHAGEASPAELWVHAKLLENPCDLG